MITLIIFIVLIGFIPVGVPIAVAMGLTAVLTFIFVAMAMTGHGDHEDEH